MGRSSKSTSAAGRLAKDAAVAIIGCGIAGLSTAISLMQAGYTNLSIFERDACQETRREGFGLTLSYNPKGPLAQLGILEEVSQRDCPSRSHYIFNPQGGVLGYYGNHFSASKRGFGQRGNIRCPRQVLQRIMMQRFLDLAKEFNCSSSARVYWSQTVTDIQHAGDKVQLHFHQIEESKLFDLIIASDGVRSSVVQILAPQCRPRPLNVMIILGISENFQHPLLTERGFYTIGDGKHRLFTMPYEGDKYATRRRIMWQLSYRYDDDDDDLVSKELYREPTWLRDNVMNRCSTWHEPIASLIRATPLKTIWGTPLFDRDPSDTLRAFQSFKRIILVGDALHAMSPFKGQGANQALLDGPLIATWLQGARVDAAVRGIWREAVARTDKVVQASRDAAQFWHSSACIPTLGNELNLQVCHFAGVRADAYEKLIQVLSQRKINAILASSLDAAIGQVIEELGIAKVENVSDRFENEDPNLTLEILKYAKQGATSSLRQISLINASAIRSARDENGQSCLHLAAMSGHFDTCRWLLTEAQVDPLSLDRQGRSPLDEASDSSVRALFERMQHTRTVIGVSQCRTDCM